MRKHTWRRCSASSGPTGNNPDGEGIGGKTHALVGPTPSAYPSIAFARDQGILVGTTHLNKRGKARMDLVRTLKRGLTSCWCQNRLTFSTGMRSSSIGRRMTPDDHLGCMDMLYTLSLCPIMPCSFVAYIFLAVCFLSSSPQPHLLLSCELRILWPRPAPSLPK